MRFVKIPKKSGGTRTICCPGRRHKAFLRRLLPPLVRVSQAVSPEWVVHGFMPGRNPVTNARQHTGYAYSVCMDLSDFFDSVRPEMIEGTGAEKYNRFTFIRGRAYQGLPTSPVVANIAGRLFDWPILELVRSLPGYGNYTRYADDLTISFYDREAISVVLREVPKIVKAVGFKVNRKKTKVLCASNGRRHITGVAVDKDVHPTREMKRRLRAARHQGNDSSADGLAMWCKCPLPKGYQDHIIAKMDEAAKSLGDVWDV